MLTASESSTGIEFAEILKGAKTRSCRRHVFVNHAAETIAALDHAPRYERRAAGSIRWRQAQCPVRSVPVVVRHELGEDPLQVRLVEDQEPIEAFPANRSHEPLGHRIRLRGPKRRPDNLDPLTGKHFVEGPCEFLIPVANQEAE